MISPVLSFSVWFGASYTTRPVTQNARRPVSVRASRWQRVCYNQQMTEPSPEKSNLKHRQCAGKYRVIAFDFDGVIADSMRTQATAWCHAVRAVGVGSKVKEQLMHNFWKGASGRRMFERVYLDPETLNRLRQAKDDEFKQLEPTVTPFEGCEEALAALTVSRRHKLTIATTASHTRLRNFLERNSLTDYFDELITDSDVSQGKPHPEMLHRTATEAGCRPQDVCLVGDTETDFRMARSGGTAFLLFESHPDHGVPDEAARVRSWQELQKLFCEAA
jgi:phosphoglycolate phosphatase